MKQKVFDKKDGTKGTEYSLEDGDVVISRFAQVKAADGAILKDGKAVPTKRYFLGVTDSKLGDIVIKVTAGQNKVLAKTADLTGKTITARGYKNDYGNQVGVTVK